MQKRVSLRAKGTERNAGLKEDEQKMRSHGIKAIAPAMNPMSDEAHGKPSLSYWTRQERSANFASSRPERVTPEQATHHGDSKERKDASEDVAQQRLGRLLCKEDPSSGQRQTAREDADT